MSLQESSRPTGENSSTRPLGNPDPSGHQAWVLSCLLPWWPVRLGDICEVSSPRWAQSLHLPMGGLNSRSLDLSGVSVN